MGVEAMGPWGDGTVGKEEIGGILAIAGYYDPKIVVNSVRSHGFVWMCRVVVYRKETILSRSWV